MRDHDVTALTGRELEQARRELAASLALGGLCGVAMGRGLE